MIRAVDPWLVVLGYVDRDRTAENIECDSEHLGIRHVIDHHVVVAGNGHTRSKRGDEACRLSGAQVVVSAIDAYCADIGGSGEQRAQQFAPRSVARIEESDVSGELEKNSAVVQVGGICWQGESSCYLHVPEGAGL